MAVKRAAIFHKFKGQMLYYLVPVSIKNRVTFVSQNKRGVRFVTFFWVSFFFGVGKGGGTACTGSFGIVGKGGSSQVTDVYCIRVFFRSCFFIYIFADFLLVF